MLLGPIWNTIFYNIEIELRSLKTGFKSTCNHNVIDPDKVMLLFFRPYQLKPKGEKSFFSIVL